MHGVFSKGERVRAARKVEKLITLYLQVKAPLARRFFQAAEQLAVERLVPQPAVERPAVGVLPRLPGSTYDVAGPSWLSRFLTASAMNSGPLSLLGWSLFRGRQGLGRRSGPRPPDLNSFCYCYVRRSHRPTL